MPRVYQATQNQRGKCWSIFTSLCVSHQIKAALCSFLQQFKAAVNVGAFSKHAVQKRGCLSRNNLPQKDDALLDTSITFLVDVGVLKFESTCSGRKMSEMIYWSCFI